MLSVLLLMSLSWYVLPAAASVWCSSRGAITTSIISPSRPLAAAPSIWIAFSQKCSLLNGSQGYRNNYSQNADCKIEMHKKCVSFFAWWGVRGVRHLSPLNAASESLSETILRLSCEIIAPCLPCPSNSLLRGLVQVDFSAVNGADDIFAALVGLSARLVLET